MMNLLILLWKLCSSPLDIKHSRDIVGDNRSITSFVDRRDKVSTPLIWKIVLLKDECEQMEDGSHKA